jgi:hypothetical protein
MADDQSNLLAALMGQQTQAAPQQNSPFYYPGSESIYGTVGSTIASALPSLVSPTASVGQNLGVTLGGALIASLLGYKARQETNEAGLLTARLASQMMEAPTSEARQAILESAPTGFMAPNVQGRLLKFESALVDQQMKQRAAQQQALAELQSKAAFAMSPLGQALNTMETNQAVAREGATAKARWAARPADVGAAMTPEEAYNLELNKQRARNAAQTELVNSPEYQKGKAALEKIKNQEALNRQLTVLGNQQTFKTGQTQEERKYKEERDKILQAAKNERDDKVRQEQYDRLLQLEQIRYDNARKAVKEDLRLPPKTVIAQSQEAEATVARLEAIADQWRRLNGGKGYTGAEVKLGIQDGGSEIGRLYNETVGIYGAINNLQGMSAQMSNTDRAGIENSVFGNFFGVHAAIPSKVIAENILAQIPPAAKQGPTQLFKRWKDIVDAGLDETSGTTNYTQANIASTKALRINGLKSMAANVKADPTLSPEEKQSALNQILDNIKAIQQAQ